MLRINRDLDLNYSVWISAYVRKSLSIVGFDHPWIFYRSRVAIGPGAGSRTLTLKNPGLQRSETQPKPFTVDRNGFSLNVAVACQGQQRERLERLCRYVTRPAVCLERLSTNAAGQVSYELKHPFRDGTTHILFTPEDFLARLAAASCG